MNIKARFKSGNPPADRPAPPSRQLVHTGDAIAPTSAAKNLTIAHHIERMIERGLVADYTAAARLLSVSQPRVTYLMSLLLLAVIEVGRTAIPIAPRIPNPVDKWTRTSSRTLRA